MQLFSDSAKPNKDLLSRRPFAKQLAKSIISNLENKQESIVIGINGSWGNGKSTFLEYLKFELNETAIDEGNNHKIICIDYNPWFFSGQENLQRNFLIELLTTFKSPQVSNNKKLDKVESALKFFSFLKHLDKTKDYYEGLDGLLKGINLKDSIRELKTDVEKLLSEENIHLFIFIDDLDRLSPTETLEIFQLVKLNSSFINTYYFLAYDRDVIEKSLSITYKENAKKYLEKIVQIDYKIPEPRLEDIEYVFFTRFDDLAKKHLIEYEEKHIKNIWHLEKFSYYFKNLREVYRFLNAIQLRLPSIWRDVNIYDFLIIEGIRIFDYENYESFLSWTLETQKEFRGFEEKIKLIENPTTKSLLLNITAEKSHYNKNGRSYVKIAKKEIYFTFQLGSNDLSVIDFEKFTKNPTIDFLEIMYKNNQLDSFVSNLSHLYEFDCQKSYYFIINSIFEFLENDEIIRVCSNNVYYALMESAQNDDTLLLKIVDELLADKSKLSQSQLLFIKWILNDKIFSNQIYDETILKLHSKQEEIFEKWQSHVFGRYNLKNPIWITPLFFEYFIRKPKNDYYEIMKPVLENEVSLLGLLKLMSEINTQLNKKILVINRNFNSWIRIFPEILSLFEEKYTEFYNTKFKGLPEEDKKFIELFKGCYLEL